MYLNSRSNGVIGKLRNIVDEGWNKEYERARQRKSNGGTFRSGFSRIQPFSLAPNNRKRAAKRSSSTAHTVREKSSRANVCGFFFLGNCELLLARTVPRVLVVGVSGSRWTWTLNSPSPYVPDEPHRNEVPDWGLVSSTADWCHRGCWVYTNYLVESYLQYCFSINVWNMLYFQ